MIKSLLIDSREPDWCRSLAIGTIRATVSQLPVGDAWIATEDSALVIERKTLNDLCASIADNRLINQVDAMTKASKWAYVVITGIPSVANGMLVIGGKPSNWAWRSIQGMLLTIQELGCSVIWCESETQYGSTLEWIANRARADVRVEPRRDVTLLSDAEVVLSSFPGIGPERAKILLEKSGSLAWAIDFLTGIYGSEMKVPGVGPATKAAVRNVLGLKDGMKLEVTGLVDPQGESENE